MERRIQAANPHKEQVLAIVETLSLLLEDHPDFVLTGKTPIGDITITPIYADRNVAAPKDLQLAQDIAKRNDRLSETLPDTRLEAGEINCFEVTLVSPPSARWITGQRITMSLHPTGDCQMIRFADNQSVELRPVSEKIPIMRHILSTYAAKLNRASGTEQASLEVERDAKLAQYHFTPEFNTILYAVSDFLEQAQQTAMTDEEKGSLEDRRYWCGLYVKIMRWLLNQDDGEIANLKSSRCS